MLATDPQPGHCWCCIHLSFLCLQGGAQQRLVEVPAAIKSTQDDLMLPCLQTMMRMRRVEIAADMLYKQKLARGFLHLADGQEAVPVGMEAALTFQDSVIQSYRDHLTFIGRGGTVKACFAELLVRCGRSQGSWQWGSWPLGAAAGPAFCRAELQGQVDLHGASPDHEGMLYGAAGDLMAVGGEMEVTGYVTCLDLSGRTCCGLLSCW